MAKVGAQRAAELTGKSKSTVQRAMNSGKLSFELDANGRRVIDVSELERVFGLKGDAAKSTNNNHFFLLNPNNPLNSKEKLNEAIFHLGGSHNYAGFELNNFKKTINFFPL